MFTSIQSLLATASGIAKHAPIIWESIWGKVIIFASTLLSLLGPDWLCFAVVYGAIASDLFWGVKAAKKANKYVLSKALRNTVDKVTIYSFSLIGVFLVEHIAHDGWMLGIKIMAIYACSCEFFSMSASMLIVRPDMPFLRIFQHQLRGEMESKLGKNMVEELFPIEKNEQHG